MNGCSSVLHPNCVSDGNPEYWPIIGPLITDLTDAVGMLFPTTGCQNGWWGLGLLAVIVGGGYYLVKKKKILKKLK